MNTEPTVIDRRPQFSDAPPEPPKPFTAKPLGSYIAVKRIPEPEGLIIQADIAKEKPLECEVLAVARDVADVKPGDKVLIRRFSGTEVKVGDHEITLILIQDVLLRL